MFVCQVVSKSAAKSRILSDGEARHNRRGGGLGSRPKKMYGERLGDGDEYHLMSPTPSRYRMEKLGTIGTCVSILIAAYVYLCQIVSKSSAQSQIVSRSVDSWIVYL